MKSLGAWPRMEPGRFPVLLAALLTLNIPALDAIGGMPVAAAAILLVAAYPTGRRP